MARSVKTIGTRARGQSPAGYARGFTLLEIIVAVAAIAVISVGVASILSAVGKTVSGGRRTSFVTQYAALLEAQMRSDFEAMTRDGFLLIRNQAVDVTGNGQIEIDDVVPVSPDDPRPRVRRVDEILFFARRGAQAETRLESQSTARRGFTTARQPVLPELVTSSNVARIYYGHGLIPADAPTGSFRYARPNVGDIVDGTGLSLGEQADGNPNRYAADWTLLRHVLLMLPETATRSDKFTRPVFGIDPASAAGFERLRDKDWQVDLQPATATVFRAFNQRSPAATPQASTFRTCFGPTGGDVIQANRPIVASGLVDIATTDLAETRAIVTTFPEFPRKLYGAATIEWSPRVVATPPNVSTGTFEAPGEDVAVDRQHAWMLNALPGNSTVKALVHGSEPSDDPTRSRLRYLPSPADLVPTLARTAANPDDERDRFLARADQLMLSASNFAPRCTEFIVEWTFGAVDEDGQLVWHGLWRREDLNRNGQFDDNEFLVRPYPFAADGTEFEVSQNLSFNLLTGVPLPIPVSSRLIHGEVGMAVSRASGESALLDSFFGYTDPTIPVDTSLLAGSSDSNGDGDPLNDALDVSRASQVVPWRWPELIRVTMSLADPQEPTIETTFQFVFGVPKQ